jgi:hypothetical protein
VPSELRIATRVRRQPPRNAGNWQRTETPLFRLTGQDAMYFVEKCFPPLSLFGPNVRWLLKDLVVARIKPRLPKLQCTQLGSSGVFRFWYSFAEIQMEHSSVCWRLNQSTQFHVVTLLGVVLVVLNIEVNMYTATSRSDDSPQYSQDFWAMF